MTAGSQRYVSIGTANKRTRAPSDVGSLAASIAVATQERSELAFRYVASINIAAAAGNAVRIQNKKEETRGSRCRHV